MWFWLLQFKWLRAVPLAILIHMLSVFITPVNRAQAMQLFPKVFSNINKQKTYIVLKISSYISIATLYCISFVEKKEKK